MSAQQFAKALDRGDVVTAILAAPFGYRSQSIDGGFRFTIDDGRVGVGPTLLDAVRAAVSPLSERSGPEPEDRTP